MASNTIQPKSKNSMPSFATGTLANLQKLYTDGKMSAPAFCFVKDTNDEYMAFLDSSGTWHKVLIERIKTLEDQLADLVDPETGKPISVKEYVEEQIEPVQDQVDTIQTSVSMITSIGG